MITREGEHGEFETLEKEILYQTLDDIESKFGIETHLDPFGERGNGSDSSGGESSQESAETEPATEQSESDGAGTESGDDPAEPTTESEPSADEHADHDRDEPESTSASQGDESSGDPTEQTEDTTGSETTTSGIATTEDTGGESNSDVETESVSDATTQDSDIKLGSEDSGDSTTDDGGDDDDDTGSDQGVPDEVAEQYGSESAFDGDTSNADLNPEGGVPSSDLSMLNDDPEADTTIGEDSSDDDGSSSKHERFKTYSEPGDSVGDFDEDKEAVKQFVNEFATVDPHSKDETYAEREVVYDTFTTWYKINQLDTPKLTTDLPASNRKGNLKKILNNLFELDIKRPQIDGERTRIYAGIELSETGKELENVEVN